MMKYYTQDLTLMGTVEDVDPALTAFTVCCQSGDRFVVHVDEETVFAVLKNLDGLDNDRFPLPLNYVDDVAGRLRRYISKGKLVTVVGIRYLHEGARRYEGRIVYLLTSVKDSFLFEETHWWLTQTTTLADRWLDSLFGDKRDYREEDFVALYRTNLNILGLPTGDEIQECAVLSRLIYGFCAAYLLTGQDRYLKAAKAGVEFQRSAFRGSSHDGKYYFWAYGRRRNRYGTRILGPSESDDDKGSIPLYEQIYALAGLALYYRISLDRQVLEDIRGTLDAFNSFYLDDFRQGDPVFGGKDGWFSHIDYSTLRPELNANPANNCKKNWNSVGDHIPAYLINLILSLDPLPKGHQEQFDALMQTCRRMLDRATRLILDKFVDVSPSVPYVNERFFADWTPDHTYSWQQNRAIVGHNFKIAWNLSRIAAYYDRLSTSNFRNGASEVGRESSENYASLAKRCRDMANRLTRAMSEVGFDQIRGGCFDAVKRDPDNGQPMQFAWMNTKDFWQQEQAILAYLITYGWSGNPLFLDMGRRAEAFWNVFFLDRDNLGMFFRVTDNGLPVLGATYGVRGGHSDASGYHCFELNYLAHIYNRCYVAPTNGTDTSFTLHFRPDVNCRMNSINVLPDFIPPGLVEIVNVKINGVVRELRDSTSFQIDLIDADLGQSIVVEFRVLKRKSRYA